jgi:hypothetical protein
MLQLASMTCRDEEDRGTVMMAEPTSPDGAFTS